MFGLEKLDDVLSIKDALFASQLQTCEKYPQQIENFHCQHALDILLNAEQSA